MLIGRLGYPNSFSLYPRNIIDILSHSVCAFPASSKFQGAIRITLCIVQPQVVSPKPTLLLLISYHAFILLLAIFRRSLIKLLTAKDNSADCRAAVSYTHLDVYKRQVLFYQANFFVLF